MNTTEQKVSTTDALACPFCGESEFDRVGLKSHLSKDECQGWVVTGSIRSPLDGIASIPHPDAARLDWLEANHRDVFTYGTNHWTVNRDRDGRVFDAPSLRGVIDAAMAKEAK